MPVGAALMGAVVALGALGSVYVGNAAAAAAAAFTALVWSMCGIGDIMVCARCIGMIAAVPPAAVAGALCRRKARATAAFTSCTCENGCDGDGGGSGRTKPSFVRSNESFDRLERTHDRCGPY